MIRVVVYTSGGTCMQCALTKQVMDAVGLAFVTVDLSLPGNAAEFTYVTKTLGYSTVPVVVVDGREHWTGFQPDAIKAIAARVGAAAASGEC